MLVTVLNMPYESRTLRFSTSSCEGCLYVLADMFG
jgi:hypothetical protein